MAYVKLKRSINWKDLPEAEMSYFQSRKRLALLNNRSPATHYPMTVPAHLSSTS